MAASVLLTLPSPASGGAASSPWSSLSGFRLLGPAGGVAETRFTATRDGETFSLIVRADGPHRRIFDKDGEIEIALRVEGEALEIESAGRRLRGVFEQSANRARLTLGGEVYAIDVQSEVVVRAGSKATASGSGAVLAPMPGVVAEVRTAPGDSVDAGQVVVVLESMKLFTSLSARVVGTVTDVACAPGDTVTAGKRLVLIEPSAAT